MRTVVCCAFVLGAGSFCSAQIEPIEPWHAWPDLAVEAGPAEIESVSPRVVWRLDCLADDGPVIGKITAAAPGLDGRILLVDSQTVQVLVISPAGEIERVACRRGEGPGEVRRVFRALHLADGRIGTVDGAESHTFMIGGRGELVLVDEANDPAGVWRVAGDSGHVPLCNVRGLRCALPYILVASIRTLVAGDLLMTNYSEMSLVSAEDGSREVVAQRIWRYESKPGLIHELDAFEPFANSRCDINPSGQIAFAPDRDRWRVCVREIDGRGVVLERPWSPARRTAEQYSAAMERHGVPKYHVLDHEPAIGRLFWRPDGLLWVEPGGWSPAGDELACFDELSVDGNLLRRVEVNVLESVSGDRLLFLEDGRFVLLRGFGEHSGDEMGMSPEVWLLEL